MKVKISWMVILLLVGSGCTKIQPSGFSDLDVERPDSFSHENYERVLQDFVDEQGRVNYQALKENSLNLDRYFQLIATISPDSHSHIFPTKESKLAYWLNAYNAATIKTVLNYYPISSVRDVKKFLLPKGAGFFVLQRITFGGKTTNLYYLGNSVVRRRFSEPRVHFALNCAARGCPRLPRYPFSVKQLDEQLDYEARKFLSEKRNFMVDHDKKTIWLSSIFKWYKSDFIEWYKHEYPDEQASLISYMKLYLPEKKRVELNSVTADYKVKFIPYDWRLNGQ